MLLSVAKVLWEMILERMKYAVEDRLRDEQAGFRNSEERSWCDQIFVEQTLIQNTGLLVDVEKA